MCSLKVRKYHRKMPALESVFNKVGGIRTCNFITKELQYRCFPVKFAKFLRISILKNIYKGLLLYFHYDSIIIFSIITFTAIRNSRLQMFDKIGVLKKFCKFLRKTPMLESLFNKVADLRAATLIKGDINTGVFLRNFRIFKEHLFLQNISGGRFCAIVKSTFIV